MAKTARPAAAKRPEAKAAASPRREGAAKARTSKRGAEPRGYDELKEFQGQRYTGMKVGRRHKWRYDAGEWTEQKVTPDRWEFHYAVVKRRAGRAPEGSGAPVGTGYRWTIVAEQIVTKLDANSYRTEMVGVKLKLAHRRAGQPSWNASERRQRARKVEFLEGMAAEVEGGRDRAAVETAPELIAAARPERAGAAKERATARPKARATARPKARATARPKARATARPKARAKARPKARATARPRARATAKAAARRPRSAA